MSEEFWRFWSCKGEEISEFGTDSSDEVEEVPEGGGDRVEEDINSDLVKNKFFFCESPRPG